MSTGRGRTVGLRGLDPVRPGFGFRGGKTALPTLRSPSMWRRALAKDSTLRHVDWILVLAVLGLSLIGTLLVWSATAPGLRQVGANPRAYAALANGGHCTARGSARPCCPRPGRSSRRSRRRWPGTCPCPVARWATSGTR